MMRMILVLETMRTSRKHPPKRNDRSPRAWINQFLNLQRRDQWTRNTKPRVRKTRRAKKRKKILRPPVQNLESLPQSTG